MKETNSKQIDSEQPTQIPVAMSANDWSAILQFMSIGVRHADDSALELGGRLLTQLKRQVG